MDLSKRDNESPLEYHKRIVYGKIVDKTLADVDYTELSELAYGQAYSSDVARRMFYGSRRTLDLMESERVSATEDKNMLSEIDEKMIELQKERQKFSDQRAAFNRSVRDRSRQEELNEILIQAIKEGNLPELHYEPTYIEPSNNDLLVSLSDIHYGIEINNAWNTYNPEKCRQMMQDYLCHIIRIAGTHNSENCIVYNCGDNISGKIHQTIQLANRENVVEQVKNVSELIASFLAALSSQFKTVRYVSVAGNHSRLDTKDNAPNDERMDDLVEWYLAARLHEFENIQICSESRVDPTMCLMDIRGKLYCGVHGDFDCSDSKLAALQSLVQKPLYAILMGHRHHSKVDTVQGVKVIMSGSFCGMDDYCVKNRIYGKPEQMVCVCDKDGVMCYYDIQLD